MSGLYPHLAPIERLDARDVGYRFDLEQDVAWDAFDAPGRYVPDVLLREAGIDPGPFRAVPAADQELQWGAATLLCREFVELEKLILRFVAEQQSSVRPSIALDALVKEEGKHITLFNRYQKKLAQQHEDWAARLHQATSTLSNRRFALGEGDKLPPAAFHYLVWLDILFFEEATVRVHHLLLDMKEPVQPCWLTAHACHRREEAQHIVTDSAYLSALALPDGERDLATRFFAHELLEKFFDAGAYLAWADDVAKRHLGRDAAPRVPDHDRPARLGAVLAHRAFARTRHAAPVLDKYAQLSRAA